MIDSGGPAHDYTMELATKIANCSSSKLEYINLVFVYVRDQIANSANLNAKTVTRQALEILNVGHSICYTKYYLLAALLRCQAISKGSCFQKLILDDETTLF